MSILVSAGCVVSEGRLLRPGWIEVHDRVLAVGAGSPPRPADVELGDATIVPGFVDTHVHGGGGGAFSQASATSTQAVLDLHRRHGTTSLVASLVSAGPEDLLRQVDVLADQTQDSLIAGIHLEGPWLSHRRCGAHEPSALRDPEPDEIDRLLAAGRGSIRMVTIAPELTGALPAIRQIVDGGAVAAIGHTDGSYELAREAIGAGATVGTHLFNAMRPVHHREPGPVVALLEDERVTVEMIADGIHLHPALYRDVVTRVGSHRVSLVTDAMSAAGMPDGDYELGTLGVQVVDGVARLAGADTIAGSTATMDSLFRFATTHASADPDTALLSAVEQSSQAPARALGLPDPTLAPGAAADLVVLDKHFQVTKVMCAGSWHRAAEQLEQEA